MAKSPKASDVRAKTPDELSALVLDLRKEQFNLRFQRATGQQHAHASLSCQRLRGGDDVACKGGATQCGVDAVCVGGGLADIEHGVMREIAGW